MKYLIESEDLLFVQSRVIVVQNIDCSKFDSYCFLLISVSQRRVHVDVDNLVNVG